MTIQDIVLHQGRDSRSTARLEAAVMLAKVHGARVIGVYANAFSVTRGKTWWELGGEGLSRWKDGFARWRSAQENAVAEAKAAFETRLAQEGLSGEWRVMEGDPTDAMISAARYGDLTVVGQADPDDDSYHGSLPDHLLLGAGGPVLIVPYAGEFNTIGRRVMVAWNGTREAARAVNDAIPLLQKAETVKVYSIDPTNQRHLPGAEICRHLLRHGVNVGVSHTVLGSETDAVDPVLATVGDFGFQEPGAWVQTRHVAVGRMDVGDTLLSAVADNSIDLLVMGAYGRSRIRELVLGGATRQVLNAMTVPVLMSN